MVLQSLATRPLSRHPPSSATAQDFPPMTVTHQSPPLWKEHRHGLPLIQPMPV
ncbi:hypothetical protein [Azospirillum palustre]